MGNVKIILKRQNSCIIGIKLFFNYFISVIANLYVIVIVGH